MNGYIYKITNTVTGKIYLGSTKNFTKRVKEHLRRLRSNTHHSMKLQNSFNKYGEESFKFEILYESADIKRDEQIELDKLDLHTTYNILASSVGGDLITYHPNKEEICKKISAKSMGRRPSNAKDITINGVEYKSYYKASEALGVNHTTIRYRCLSNNPLYKDWIVVGQAKKFGSAGKGGYNSIRVVCDGVVYASYKEAALAYGLTDTSIKYRVKSAKFPTFFEETPRD